MLKVKNVGQNYGVNKDSISITGYFSWFQTSFSVLYLVGDQNGKHFKLNFEILRSLLYYSILSGILEKCVYVFYFKNPIVS